MHKIILLRHGESTWNKENIFTGWTDVDLDETGMEQARHAATLIKEKGFQVDVAYTSFLKRAIRTLWIVLDELDSMWIPEYKSWRLNERHYGALQGLNKAATAEQYGEEQVKLWRRCYSVPPPALEDGDSRTSQHDRRYYDEHDACAIPQTESLKDTFDRVLPYWHDQISPMIRTGKQVIVVAHGNTLRALVKYLDNMSDEAVEDLNIPVSQPLVYELDDELHAVSHYYLDDPNVIAQGVTAVINQGVPDAQEAAH